MAFAGGTGTELDPYLVSTAEQLNDVRNYLTSYFLQVADIDLSGYTNWIPIGTPNVKFEGCYDGGNYTIDKLTMRSQNINNLGLFGYVGSTINHNIIFKNINLRTVDFDITSSVWTNGNYIGGLIGALVGGTILNCSVDGVFNLHGCQFVGGLVGRYSEFRPTSMPDRLTKISRIENCYTNVTINISWLTGTNTDGMKFIGGLIGEFYGFSTDLTIIKNCYSLGDILSVITIASSYNYISNVGGLLGYFGKAKIEQCYATGDVTGWELIGGLIGEIYNYGYVINCYARGNILLPIGFETYIGDTTQLLSLSGFCGGGSTSETDSKFNIINCYSTGSIYTPNNSSSGFMDNTVEYSNILGCYYDYTICPIEDLLATPKTTAEMKTQATFINWDFDTVWVIDSGTNDGYPCFEIIASGFNIYIHTGTELKQVQQIFIITDTGLKEVTEVATITDAGLKYS